MKAALRYSLHASWSRFRSVLVPSRQHRGQFTIWQNSQQTWLAAVWNLLCNNSDSANIGYNQAATINGGIQGRTAWLLPLEAGLESAQVATAVYKDTADAGHMEAHTIEPNHEMLRKASVNYDNNGLSGMQHGIVLTQGNGIGNYIGEKDIWQQLMLSACVMGWRNLDSTTLWHRVFTAPGLQRELHTPLQELLPVQLSIPLCPRWKQTRIP